MIQSGNKDLRWDDLRTPSNTVKLDSTKPPSETAYKGGSVLSFSKTSNNKIYFNVQLPHNRQTGSDIEFHLHYVLKTPGAGLGTENVKFIFTYSWANIGEAFPAETTVTSTKDVGMYQTPDTHILHEVSASIAGTGKTLSSMLICSLERDTSVSDNYDDKVYLMEVDFHYLIDSLGSKQETVK